MELHIGYGALRPATHNRTGKSYMVFTEVGAQDDKGIDLHHLLPEIRERIERARDLRIIAAKESKREAARR